MNSALRKLNNDTILFSNMYSTNSPHCPHSVSFIAIFLKLRIQLGAHTEFRSHVFLHLLNTLHSHFSGAQILVERSYICLLWLIISLGLAVFVESAS